MTDVIIERQDIRNITPTVFAINGSLRTGSLNNSLCARDVETRPKSQTYRVGPKHPTGVAAPPYHIATSVVKYSSVRKAILEGCTPGHRTREQTNQAPRAVYHWQEYVDVWKLPNDRHTRKRPSLQGPNSFGESTTLLLERLSRNRSRSQNTQCHSEAAHSKPAKTKSYTLDRPRVSRTRFSSTPSRPRTSNTKPREHVPKSRIRKPGRDRIEPRVSWSLASNRAIDAAHPDTRPVWNS